MRSSSGLSKDEIEWTSVQKYLIISKYLVYFSLYIIKIHEIKKGAITKSEYRGCLKSFYIKSHSPLCCKQFNKCSNMVCLQNCKVNTLLNWHCSLSKLKLCPNKRTNGWRKHK